MKSVAPLLLLAFLSTSIFGMAQKTFKVSRNLNSGGQETVPFHPSFIESRTWVNAKWLEIVFKEGLSSGFHISHEQKKEIVAKYIKDNQHKRIKIAELFSIPISKKDADLLFRLMKEVYWKERCKLESIIPKKRDQLLTIMEVANYLDIPLLLKASINVAAKFLVYKLELKKINSDFQLWACRIHNDIGAKIVKKIIEYYPSLLRDIPVPSINTYKIPFGWVSSTCFSSDGSYVICGGSDKTINIWDIKKGKHIKKFSEHLGTVSTLCSIPNSEYLVSGSWDKSVKIWDMKNFRCVQTFEGHTDLIMSISCSPDGKYIASGGTDSQVKIWDIQKGKEFKTLSGHYARVWSVCFSPDGTYLASAGYDKKIRIWNVQTGKCVKILTGHAGSIGSICFSPNGALIASGSWDNTIKIWDVEKNLCTKTIYGHKNCVEKVIFTPDGKYIVSSSKADEFFEGSDSKIMIWNIKKGQCIKEISSLYNLFSMSSDGNYITFSLTPKAISVCSMENFKMFHNLTLSQLLIWMTTKKKKATFKFSEFLRNYTNHMLKGAHTLT